MAVENDIDIGNRVYVCSSVQTCYNHKKKNYENSKCSEFESCGAWTTDKTYEGCILNKYCGVSALYTHNDPTTYTCPDSQKEEPNIVK